MTEAGAQLLDAEGTALLDKRQLEAACPKLEQSFRIKPGTGVLLRLALCQELSGKWASALASYLEAIRRAEAAGDQQLVRLAKKRAAALQPRLSYLTVDLDPSLQDVSGLRVSCDGTPLAPATLGTDLPLDPGPHSIEAVASGRKRFEQTVVVNDEGKRYAVTVLLPLETVALEPAAASEPPRAPPNPEQSSWSTQRTLALVAGGVGIAGITAGTFLGLAAGSRMQRARGLCSDGQSGCSDEALALQDQAGGFALGSTIAFGVGAAGLVGGIGLWLTAPNHSERPRDARVRVVPIIGIGSGGIQAVGTW
ncbi:MAG TPA: hypothetical protein VFK05_02605 [Polyangiaceae bacterium]|nr:hypothetical protein [Polyangiaceae bacterium]